MAISLSDALDGARYVEFAPDLDSAFAVWHGGHTVNFYVIHHPNDLLEVRPTDTINVGDFAEDSATIGEVKEGIATMWDDELR